MFSGILPTEWDVVLEAASHWLLRLGLIGLGVLLGLPANVHHHLVSFWPWYVGGYVVILAGVKLAQAWPEIKGQVEEIYYVFCPRRDPGPVRHETIPLPEELRGFRR